MIPENVDRFTTEGERQFYGFLKKVAKPDAQFISWYTPDIKGREPDFLLFNKRVGIIVFEVKDWALDQIQKANPQHFVIYSGGKHDSRTNLLSLDPLLDKYNLPAICLIVAYGPAKTRPTCHRYALNPRIA